MKPCQPAKVPAAVPGVNEISISMILGTINLDIDGDIILLNIDRFIDF